MKLFNLTKNKVVVENLTIAGSYRERTKGLLGRQNIDAHEGLIIKNCNWIHTFFMKFPIDAVFLRTQMSQIKDTDYADKTIYKVVKIAENIKPWRLSSPVFRADSVLEIKSGSAKNIISIDDELKITEDL